MAVQLIYLGGNVFCTCFKVSTADEAATRAGNLSLINMMPTYFGFHLSFIYDLLGVSLLMYRLFHALTGIMSVLLDLLHVIIHTVDKLSLSMSGSGQLFELIVSHCAPQGFDSC